MERCLLKREQILKEGTEFKREVNMARREISGMTDTIKITTEEYLKKTLSGYYLGSRTISNKFGDDAEIHNFLGDDGEFGIWGFTVLNNCVMNIPKHAMVWITYQGKSDKKSKYGNYPHLCTVEVDVADVLGSGGDPDDIVKKPLEISDCINDGTENEEEPF